MLRNLKEEKSKLQMKVKVKLKSLSRVRLFATPWSVAYHLLPLHVSNTPSPNWDNQKCPRHFQMSPGGGGGGGNYAG